MSASMFPQQRFHVTEALERNSTAIQEIMDPTPGFSFVSLPALALTSVVSFRRREYSHVDLERCLTDDHIEGRPQDGAVDFYPAFSLRLTNGNEEGEGLITRVSFADYSLSQGFFANDGTPRVPLGQLLVPTQYSVYRGRHFVAPEDEDEGQALGGGVLGGPAEKGAEARLAAETIDKMSDVIRTLGHDTLAGMYVRID